MATRPAKEITIADVASASGFSVGTVSNYLNRPHALAPATKARISQAIDDLGWVPNVAVRAVRRGYSQLLGLVLSDMNNPFFTDVARGVEHAATEAGYALVLCNSDNDPRRQERYLDTLAEHRAAGILMTPVAGLPDKHYVRLGEHYGGHVVLLAQPHRRPSLRLPYVAVDDAHGGLLVGRHLIDLGHRYICAVHATAEGAGPTAERLEGLRSAISEAPKSRRPRLVEISTTGLHLADGAEASERLLAMSPRPTAAFLANDLMAVGMVKALTKAGARVPEEISIVGYDNLELSQVSSPALTTVDQPRFSLGAAGVELLLAKIAGKPSARREIVFTPELVVRGSTAPPPR